MSAPVRRKVVIVVKGYPRLSETFIAQEIRGLELAGLELVIVALRHPTDRKRHAVHGEITAPVHYLPEYLHREPIRVMRAVWSGLRRPGMRGLWSDFLADLRRDPSRNRVRRLGQALVLAAEWPEGAGWLHAHFIHTPASVAEYAARIVGLPWTVSAHAKDIWTSPDWDLQRKLRAARWTVTCTASGHRHLQQLAGPASARVNLSYHGLNLERFPPHVDDRPARDGQQADDPVRLISVGRLVPKKGYDFLLEALALLPADLSWRFVHAGGGDVTALRAQAARLGLSAHIDWRGALDQAEVLALYRRSDIFALACRVTSDGDRDGLPNVLVEAASQGLTCVSTSISGIPELFSDGENGLLVPAEDPTALAQALEKAIRHPEMRRVLGAAAQQKVRKTLDYHVSVAQLVDLFEKEWTQTA
ncbi:colanic acid biosynthesis glycosyltransferase WcaL [Pseudooceanicola sediminis]|uniref:Colanic acid biosynthesis glycosyltransferase WcaL n=1 Tax=Pseudooceanicola sediminis TaxID=2211117 RepID=A0A399IY00_9RHOB|nr:glycosyltransferase family 4 protein [Pseudooceanicola sediminis]RII37901.1 colanic acid biosynthesis glycosyltransferase WcaL [Pseudooceanicola sediminis]|tara:strand:+ start:16775 stop:18028 length:1254 start_codon:yes stop_codon:yes gene_type:complete